MIRIVLGLFVVSVGVCAFILYGRDDGTGVSVTRAASQPLLSADPAATADALRDAAALLAQVPAPEEDEVPVIEVASDAPTFADVSGAPEPASGFPQTQDELRIALIEAFTLDWTDAQISALIARSIDVEGVEIPASILTGQGRVDLAPYLPDGYTPMDAVEVALREAMDSTAPVEDATEEPVEIAVPEAEQAPPVPNERDGPETYVVESGDSLSSIAEAYYGDPDDYVRILEANRDLIGDNRENIHVGWELVLP
ncbi:LysM peptidoglycan-binding domain-containing protein [Pelagovum pacificum]|nr:LysM peptidoglycan-binding domain-containing protein [Pelagovum pacificum]QQA42631.1 LysM peptidoglycan-binding domain-containing protein [Pelagovum pacificum]